MYFTLSRTRGEASAIEIAAGFFLNPSIPAADMTSERAPAIAQAYAEALLKAAPIIATQSNAYLFGRDAERSGYTKTGFLSVITPDDSAAQVLGAQVDASNFGLYGDYILELSKENLMDRFGLPNIVIEPLQLPDVPFDSSLLTTSITIHSNSEPFEIKRLTELGELTVGMRNRIALSDSFPDARMLQLIKRNNISGSSYKTLSSGDKALAALLRENGHSDHALQILMNIEELATINRNAFAGAQKKSTVFWSGEAIGKTIKNRGKYDLAFDSTDLHRMLGETSDQASQSEMPGFLLNWHPDKLADQAQYLDKAFDHGMYGLGNMAVLPEHKGPRVIDVKGQSIGDIVGDDRVYSGTIQNVARPSYFENEKATPANGDVSHAQFNSDKDELTLSGMQLKTSAYIGSGPNGPHVRKASIADITTHLIKIPKDTSGHLACVGGLEWMSMRLAKAGGLNVPEFAMMDFNQASRKYIRDEFAPAMENHSGDVNLATLDLKRNIFGAGNKLGESRVSNIALTHSDEKTAGDVVEPPGFIIERFDLPTTPKEKVIGIDFATLMGLSPGSKYDTTYEDAALALRRFSTDFESDAPELLKRIMSSWMLVDSDLHMKNLSVLARAVKGDIDNLEVRLSPAYDIVAVGGVNQVAHEGRVPLNGKLTPTLEDFVAYGVNYLDMTADHVRDAAHQMAIGMHNEIEQLRGQSVVDGYAKPAWPAMVRKHNLTRHAMTQTLDAVEASLAMKGLLPEADATKALENLAQGNPSVLATMEYLHESTGQSDARNRGDEPAPFSI